jgi:CheY-like chemotaxis protein
MKKIKLLLVDDEKEFIITLSERLQMRNFNPTCVFNGDEALESIATNAPDVMILDLKMPGIDGMEVLRRLQFTHPDIRVIVLTGHGSEKDKEAAIGLGAFGYLQKPVDIEDLTQHIQRAYENKINP